MAILKFIQIAVRLDDLIRKRSTGSPQELASRLNVSNRMVYHYIVDLKTLGAPIDYDFFQRSYFYTKDFSLEKIFLKEFS